MLLSALRSFFAKIQSWAAYIHPVDVAEMDAQRISSEPDKSDSDDVFEGYAPGVQTRSGNSAGSMSFSTFRFHRLQLDYAVNHDGVEVSVSYLPRAL